MKKLLFAAFAVVMCLTVSCQKDDDKSSIEKGGATEVSITAVMEQEGEVTRSTETEGSFAWAKGDAISIYTSTGSFIQSTLNEASHGQAEGKFVVSLEDGQTMKWFAIYPHSANHTYNNDVLRVNMPVEYGDFETEYAENTNALMLAEIVDENPTSFTFNHLAGVLRFVFKGVPANAAQVVFTANTGITGDFRLATDSEDNKVVNTVNKTESNNTVTIKFKPLTEKNDGEMKFYFPLPVGTYEGFTIAILDKHGNVGWSKKVNGTNTIKRRTLSRLPALTLTEIDGSIENPLTLEEQIAKGGIVDVDKAVETINLSGLQISDDVQININEKVGNIILYGNNPGRSAYPNITINIKKGVEYPALDFGYSAQAMVRNVTIVGDSSSDKLYNGGMQMYNGENIVINGINFGEKGFINSCGESATGVKNLTIMNCNAVDGLRNGAFITLWRTEGLTISNNKIKSTNLNDGNGCTYAQNQDVFVLNNGIKGEVLISGNEIEGSLNHHAIWIANSPEAVVTIQDNEIINAYEDAVKVDQAVNVTVKNNILGAGINGVRFDNFNGTAATLSVTGNTISTKGTPEQGYGIYLKNKSNTATDVNITSNGNVVGEAGVAAEQYFNVAETLTLSGEYELPYTVSPNSRYITYDNAYGLKDAAALKWFADEVNVKNKLFAGKTVKLLDNITLTGNWTPVGQNADSAPYFAGTFDGNEKTIHGLTVEQGAAYHAAGFFGNFRGTVQNLTFDGANITSLSAESDGATVNGTAVVAGSMVYTDGALIKNVTVRNSTVNGNRYVAAIVGYANHNCKVEGCLVEDTNVTSTPDDIKGSYDNGDKAGAIVGYSLGCNVVDNDVNRGVVHAYRDMAGIVGSAGTGTVVTGNDVIGLTLEQDYTILSSPQTTVAAIIGRFPNGESTVTHNSNTSSNVTISVIGLPVKSPTTSYRTIADALAAGETELELAEGEYDLVSISGVSSLSITGASKENTKIKMAATSYSAGGADLTFENLTILGANSGDWYLGLQHCGDVTFERCNINDGWTCYSGSGKTVFNNCDFTRNNDIHYAVNTYTSNVDFNNCTFETAGRAIHCYAEADKMCTVNVTGCTFKASKDYKGYGAVTVDARYTTFTVNISRSTAEGFPVSTTTGSALCHLKTDCGVLGTDLKLTIDGVQYLADGLTYNTNTGVAEISKPGNNNLGLAINAGASTINLGEGEYAIPAEAKGKTMKFIGTGEAANTIIKCDSNSGKGNFYGSTVEFENVAIESVLSSHNGFEHIAKASYNKCILNNTHTLYGPSTFTECTFNVTGDNYNVWTYGTNSTFTGCTFNCDAKAALVYTEGAVTAEVIFDNCTFNDSGALNEAKAAVEVGESANGNLANYTVRINKCTVNGFSKTGKDGVPYEGEGYGDEFWGNKNLIPAERLHIWVNGTEVY